MATDPQTPADFARDLAQGTAEDRARLERDKLTLEWRQPIVQGHRRKRRRWTNDLPLFEPTQEDLFE